MLNGGGEMSQKYITLAVILSNAIAGLIEPSFFLNIINIKKLPFLPDIISSSSAAYNVYVEDFMNSDVRYERG